MITHEQVLDALRKIIDPDFHKDIVSLGFIKNLNIEQGKVHFDIELTTPACPVKNEFKRRAEEAVSAIQGVEGVEVKMTARKRRPSPLEEKSGLNKVDSIIAVSSCKGGVGKSTVAATIAMEISGRGFRVGLLDADIFGPSVPTLFNLHDVQVQGNADQKMLPLKVRNLKVMSFGFFLKDQPAVMRGPMVSNYIKNLLHGIDWGDLDYLILDLPPGTGDIQLTITQSARLDGAVIVTTPQILSLVDVGKGILMFDKVNVPIIGVVENMSYFICDNCSKKHFIFGGDAGEVLRERFGINLLTRLPISDVYTKSFEDYQTSELTAKLADDVIKAFGKSAFKVDRKPEIQFDESRITLKWGEGREASVDNGELRANCRCANCVHEMTGERLLKREDIPPNIRAEAITSVGNYAVSIQWSDGHSSGLYSYSLIKKLAGIQE